MCHYDYDARINWKIKCWLSWSALNHVPDVHFIRLFRPLGLSLSNTYECQLCPCSVPMDKHPTINATTQTRHVTSGKIGTSRQPDSLSELCIGWSESFHACASCCNWRLNACIGMCTLSSQSYSSGPICSAMQWICQIGCTFGHAAQCTACRELFSLGSVLLGGNANQIVINFKYCKNKRC